MKYFSEASKTVFRLPAYRRGAVLTFIIFFTLYLFILPSTYTGGRIGIISLQFITPMLTLFAFLFAFFLSFIFPFSVYAFRNKISIKNSSTAGSILSTIIPPLLCCSPLLPTLAALVAGFFPFIFGVSGFIQGFIATYEIQIFTIAVFVLIYSVWQNSKQVIYAKDGTCKI